MSEKFMQDLQKVYSIVEDNLDKINRFYEYKEDAEKQKIIDDFLDSIELEKNDETRLVAINRLVSLRDDSLVQVLKKHNIDDKRVEQIKELSYQWVKEYYLARHHEFISAIESNELLTPFYREIFKGVHSVGIAMSKWQSKWTAHIINDINKELEDRFGNEADVMSYLADNNLIDRGHNGDEADRSYSVLAKDGDGYKSVAYGEYFVDEVKEVLDRLSIFKSNLNALEDDVFNQKREYLEYLQSLIDAFGESDTDSLVARWADVDRCWMKITTPIQIGHPLEYYEDHYRKAVALEWDIRIVNPKLQGSNTRVEKIKKMYDELFGQFDDKYKRVYDMSLQNLYKAQLYLGRPALFYGAEFCGLFSAQVVPNDEVVSSEDGKKIFAFADSILQSSRAKPLMKLPKMIYGDEFVKKQREFLYQEDAKWHQVYDITTIGHEFGHILWVDEESEYVMNKSANFKNIEEFKATTGGLVSFFMNEEDNLEIKILEDTLKRAVGLIAWMEVDEVRPYYCEGMIHLAGLFESRVLTWSDKKLQLDVSEDSYKRAKEWYIDTYKQLALHYLDKKDASDFLYRYVQKIDNKILPLDENIKDFVEYYFDLYKEMGRELDTEDSKDNYTK
jgi:hypothetical protein